MADGHVTNGLTHASVGQLLQEVLGWLRPPLGCVNLQDLLARLEEPEGKGGEGGGEEESADSSIDRKSPGERSSLTSLSGSPNRNSRSKRPGRRSAGSMASSRLVAPITTTSPRVSRPSIRTSSVDTMELLQAHTRQKTRQGL